MAVGFKVTIYRRNLSAKFQSGGQGYRWLDKVKLAMHRTAVNEAPSRSGALKAGHRSTIRGLNQYACRAEISNVAEHSEWVHGGTYGPITALGDGPMKLPAGGGYSARSAWAVAGQDPNPWLDRACTKVSIRFGAVPYG